MPNLPLGTRIENSAAIYFDCNAPIITNTYFHTINNYQEPATIAAVRSIAIEELKVTLYPNPNQGIFYIEKKGDEKIEVMVMDNLGRVLLVRNAVDTLTEINISQFQTGIYYIHLNNGTKSVTHKIIKQ